MDYIFFLSGLVEHNIDAEIPVVNEKEKVEDNFGLEETLVDDI